MQILFRQAQQLHGNDRFYTFLLRAGDLVQLFATILIFVVYISAY